MKHLLPLMLLITACGHLEHSVPEQVAPGPRAELQAAFDVTSAEVVAERDQASGFPSADDCDGVLWAGLECAAGVPGVNIDLAELAPGVLGRRPGADCHAEDRDGNGKPDSGSTTSQDMALGRLMCAWRSRDLAFLQRFADACEARPFLFDGLPACIIGEPYPEAASRVVMRPNLMGLLGRAIFVLSSGSDDRPYRRVPAFHVGTPEDYEAHLRSLGITLDGEIDTALGSLDMVDITPAEKSQLESLVAADPTDWTAAAALGVYSGDFAPALALLLAPARVCPTYTRTPLNCKVSWLFAARLVLDHLTP